MTDTGYTFRTQDYILTCSVHHGLTKDAEDYLVIDAIDGDGSQLTIPERIEISSYDVAGNRMVRELPVRGIGKKAGLGKKGLTRIVCGKNLLFMDDWAFAQCDNLLQVIMTSPDAVNQFRFAKGVFEDCRKLRSIAADADEAGALGYLLGVLPCRMQAEYLLTGDDIGSAHWYEKWDQRLMSYLDEDDEEGYTNVVLCGEEDIQRSVHGFAEDKRKSKAALCLIRLCHPLLLQDLYRERMQAYLLAHTKGEETEEAWMVLLEEFADELSYFKMFAQIGAIHSENVDDMIVDMDDRSTETKAFVMRYKQEHLQTADVFDEFEL